MNRCHFELDVPNGFGDNFGENEMRKFLQTDGCDVLVDAYLKSEEMRQGIVAAARTVPRDGSATVGCTTGSQGTWSCTGSVSVGF